MKVAKHVKTPNFFIIGAPKCGTTALSEYLREHPDVHFSYPKEPNFFCNYFSEKHRGFKDINLYLNQCYYNSQGKTAVGEGSVYYLYSQEAVPNILEFNPEAKFIVMLRNPVDMAYSLHATHIRSRINENVEDFKKAWELQETRQQGKNLPPDCREPKLLQYKDVCSTGTQLKRLLERVDKSKAKIILFDDFVADTKKVYEETLAFLGVESDGRTDFSPKNENRYFKNKKLANLVSKTAKKHPRFMLVKRKMGIPEGMSILKLINRLNRVTAKRKPLDTSFKKELYKVFESELILLEEILDRDLSAWKSD
ncbi:MAG: sulfotransferase [Candidatus Delongbacteria bacterium]|jgi:hypothetical protein|nr:sulfotransferase [Candidatus Delongbacteria bacterium]